MFESVLIAEWERESRWCSIPTDDPEAKLSSETDSVRLSMENYLTTQFSELCTKNRCSLFRGLTVLYGLPLCKMGKELTNKVIIEFPCTRSVPPQNTNDNSVANTTSFLVCVDGTVETMLAYFQDAIENTVEQVESILSENSAISQSLFANAVSTAVKHENEHKNHFRFGLKLQEQQSGIRKTSCAFSL